MLTTLPRTEASQAATANGRSPRRVRFAILAMGVLCLAFSGHLFKLFQFSRGSELFSYIPLIPVISAYLVCRLWKDGSQTRDNGVAIPLILGSIGVALGLVGWAAPSLGLTLGANGRLVLHTLSFVSLINACCIYGVGPENLKRLVFPLSFLYLMAPFPDFLTSSLISFLQHCSGAVAYVFIKLTGTPILREGLVFRLPGITLEVAPECSGINSTVILLITSMVATHLFLQSAWRKWLLVLLVLPLGILRNAFRILVIGWMSSNVDPSFIDSPLHHRGGPVFFVLSLVPLFGLLLYFRWSERRGVKVG